MSQGSSKPSSQLRRQQLLQRSDQLRQQLAAQSSALQPALQAVDKCRSGVNWVRENRGLVGLATAAAFGFALSRPRQALMLGQRGLLTLGGLSRSRALVQTLARLLPRNN